MIDMLIRWLVFAGIFTAAARALPGVTTRGFKPALAAAAAFGVANLLLGWLLSWIFGVILILPRLLTLGLAGVLVPFLVNMVLLKLADEATGDALVIKGVAPLAQLSIAVTVAGVVMGWVL